MLPVWEFEWDDGGVGALLVAAISSEVAEKLVEKWYPDERHWTISDIQDGCLLYDGRPCVVIHALYQA